MLFRFPVAQGGGSSPASTSTGHGHAGSATGATCATAATDATAIGAPRGATCATRATRATDGRTGASNAPDADATSGSDTCGACPCVTLCHLDLFHFAAAWTGLLLSCLMMPSSLHISYNHTTEFQICSHTFCSCIQLQYVAIFTPNCTYLPVLL